MEQIIEECSQIKMTLFPYKQYLTITQFITEITRNIGIPYSAYQTHNKNRNHVFCCTFHGTRSGLICCNSKLVFMIVIIDNIMFFSANKIQSKLEHSHPLDVDFYLAHRNLMDSTTIKKIRDQQLIDVPPGIIRSNLNVTIDSNIFYNIRRDVIREQKTENLDLLINKLQTFR